MFQVFNEPRKNYGINYKEIDEFIANCTSHKRNYKDHKQMIKSSYVDFVDKVIAEQSFLRNELQEKDLII